MGTTSEKLTYLNTTKGKIKDSINLTGVGITNEPFRQYEVKLKDAYVDIINNGTDTLYNNFPKQTGTGETLSLTPTYQAPMKIDLKGNTNQVQLTGKNLMSSEMEQGTFNSNGEKSPSTTRIRTINTINVSSSTQYILSASFRDTKQAIIYEYNENTFIGQISSSWNALSYTFTTSSNTTKINIVIRDSGNTTITASDLTQVQLEEGSTPTTYEQYCGGVPSPNPDYPQPVQVVSGNNTITICGKNLFDKNNIIADSYLTNTGVETSATDWEISNYIKIEEGQKYTYQGLGTVGTAPYSCYYDKNKNFISSFKQATGTNTITIPNGVSYVRFSIRDTEIYPNLNTFMIEKGETASGYEAYNGTTYPINLPVENLFNKNDTNIIDNYYLLSDGTTNGNTNFYITDYIAIQPNTTYTISPYRNYSAYECFYDKDKTFISSIKISDITPSFTTPSNCKYIRLSIRKLDVDEEQLEKGSKANRYTPYGTTPIGLNKIGDYQDYFYKENDKWYLHKETEKVVLDGSENWQKNTTYQNVFFLDNIIPDRKFADNYLYTNYFIYRGQTLRSNVVKIGDAWTWDATAYLGRIVVGIEKSTKEDFITWLSAHNTIVYYILETPTNTEITDTTLIEQLEAIRLNALSYNGTTNVLQDNNDMPFIIDGSALKKD